MDTYRELHLYQILCDQDPHIGLNLINSFLISQEIHIVLHTI